MAKNFLAKLIKDQKVSYEEVKYWIKYKSDQINQIDRDSVTPLHRAVERGNIAIANILLVWGADPNAADEFGFTPLHYAVASKNAAIVELLLKNNAIADARSRNLRTPLHILSLIENDDKSIEIANLLLDYLAYPKSKDAFGYSPIEYAERAGKVELCNVFRS